MRAWTFGEGIATGWQLRHLEIQPCAENATLEEVNVAMEAPPTRRGYVRLAVMGSLLQGVERSTIGAPYCGRERAVRLWITLNDEGGIEVLASNPRSGRPRKGRLQKAQDLSVPVLENPTRAGQLHRTGVKIRGWRKEQLGTDIGYSTTLRYLHELGYIQRLPSLPWIIWLQAFPRSLENVVSSRWLTPVGTSPGGSTSMTSDWSFSLAPARTSIPSSISAGLSVPFGFGMDSFLNQSFHPIITDLARRTTSPKVTETIEAQLVKE